MKKRTRVYCIITLVIMTMSVLGSAAADSDLYEPSYALYDTTYEAILKMYIRVINAYGKKGEGRHDLFNDFICDDFYDGFTFDHNTASAAELEEYRKKKKDEIGYSICDINYDGISELVIGAGKRYIYEVFTIQEGRVRELMHAGARCKGYVLNSGHLYEEMWGGAGLYSRIEYSFDDGGKRKFYKGYYENDFYTYDGSPMGEWHGETWFRSITGNEYKGSADTKVKKSEAKGWIRERQAEIREFDFIPLSVFEIGAEGENIGILSAKGKTTGNSTVNVRKEPAKKSKVVVKKKVGTVVRIVGEDNDYYKVLIDNKEGYVQKDFVTVYNLQTN